MQPADRDEIARLIFYSVNSYYESIGRGQLLEGDPLSTGSFSTFIGRLIRVKDW